jgi:predicted nucleic acid-binding protein
MSKHIQIANRELKRLIPDSSFIVSVVNSKDALHGPCYSYWKNSEDKVLWIIPDLVFFEFQAAQSRRYQGKDEPYRELSLHRGNSRRFRITNKLLGTMWDMKLYDVFSGLKGADLLFACIAKAENLPLITCDNHFEKYADVIEIINPAKSNIL